MKRMTLALAALLVLGATASVATAQQATPPAAESSATPAPAAGAPAPAAAPAPASKIDKGDTAWMLTSSLLVLMMTAPGLALFYGGMVRQKNALGTLMHSFIIAALISRAMGALGLQSRVRSRQGRDHRRPGLDRAEGRRPRALRRLLEDHSAPGLHAVPDDVRDHHAGADHRHVRRAQEVLGLPALHLAVGDVRLRPAGALGVG